MRRTIENIVLILAFAAGVLMAFLPVLSTVTQTIFLISLGTGLMCVSVSIGLALALAPLRKPFFIIKMVLCFILLFVGGLIAQPSQQYYFLSSVWIVLSGFVVYSPKLKWKLSIFNYVAVATALVLSFFPDLRWLALAILAADAFGYVFFIEDTTDRFAAFYIASFSVIAAVYFAPGISTNASGLFLPILALCYGCLRPELNMIKDASLENEAQREEEIAIAAIEEKALRAEIRPHFMLNVLNNVLVAYHEDPQEGRRLLDQLTRLERHVSAVTDQSYVPLSEEISIINTLIQIYSLEHKQQLSFVCEIQDEQTLIPPLILEPLVENALIHSGIFNRPGGGLIRIAHRHEFGLEVLIVEDNGYGAEIDRLNQGIGVTNVHRRVGLLEAGDMTIASSSAGTKIRIAYKAPKKE